MQNKQLFIRILMSVCVVLIAYLLIFGCLSHVFTHDGTQDMYSFSSVQAHFKTFGWAYAGLIFAIALFSLFAKKSIMKAGRAKEYRRAGAVKPHARRMLRVCLFGLSAVLIVLGILNGGLYDVFVKAVNICTECIGLG